MSARDFFKILGGLIVVMVAIAAVGMWMVYHPSNTHTGIPQPAPSSSTYGDFTVTDDPSGTTTVVGPDGSSVTCGIVAGQQVCGS